jgi:hypothetical protein
MYYLTPFACAVIWWMFYEFHAPQFCKSVLLQSVKTITIKKTTHNLLNPPFQNVIGIALTPHLSF